MSYMRSVTKFWGQMILLKDTENYMEKTQLTEALVDTSHLD